MQDDEVLSRALDDCVREDFRAQLRGLQQLDDNDLIHIPARNDACLVLDRSVVFMLADLSFPEVSFPEDLRDDWSRLRKKMIKVVGAWWKRPATNVFAHRGVGYCPINSLAWFYMLISTDANSGAMQDLCLLDKSL